MYTVTPARDLSPATLGERIAAARARARLSLDQVATETGISPQRIRRIEANQASPTGSEIIALAWAAHTTVRALLATGARQRVLVGHHGPVDPDLLERVLEHFDLADHLDDYGIQAPVRAAPAR